jgi:hypothetical protein
MEKLMQCTSRYSGMTKNIDVELWVCKLVLMLPVGYLFCIEFRKRYQKQAVMMGG